MAKPAIPTLDDVRDLVLFEGITVAQLQGLLETSEIVTYSAGEVLYQGPSPAMHWWVNIEGTVDFVAIVGGEEMVFAQFDGPGRWSGGHRAWDEEGIYLGQARATSDGRVLKVPVQALQDLLASLPLVSHLTNGLFRTLRLADASIRQREAVATLGTLSAGLAHEINNPASAASRAADSLGRSVAEALSAMDRIAAGELSREQFMALATMRREISRTATTADPIAVGDREDEIATWLARHDIVGGWEIGPALASVDVDIAWCERLASARGGGAGVHPPRVRSHRRGQVVLPDGSGVPTADRHHGRHRKHAGNAGIQAARRHRGARLRPRPPPDRRGSRRPQPGLDEPHRQCRRSHGRQRDPSDLDAGR
jgi:CRP-like cAMP-binding protein